LPSYDVEAQLYSEPHWNDPRILLQREGGRTRTILRALNAIPRGGGIFSAVRKKSLTRRGLYACVLHDVDIVPDGRDSREGRNSWLTNRHYPAQKVMRQKASPMCSRKCCWRQSNIRIAVASKMLRARGNCNASNIDRSAYERAVEHQPLNNQIGLVPQTVDPFCEELAD